MGAHDGNCQGVRPAAVPGCKVGARRATTPAMLHRMSPCTWLPPWPALLVVLALLAGAASAANAADATNAPSSITPGQQARLNAAVLDHEAGHTDAARAAFEALAREEVPAALHNLAVMHLNGEHPRADAATAERLLRRAAARGFVTAMVTLARALETGAIQTGAPETGARTGRRDLAAALHWFERAAEAGSVEAALEIGTAHYLGRGRARDAAAAARWFRAAAQGGDVGAMYLLASMYENGEGVEPDLRLARYWYDIAAKNGDEAAPGKLKALDERLATQPS